MNDNRQCNVLDELSLRKFFIESLLANGALSTSLDWLIFARYTPDFVVLPGTEGMAAYNDHGFHLRGHKRALPFLAIPALAFALLTASRPWRGSKS